MIPKIERVLAPTDFSPIADAAIPHAYAVVDDGGTVHLAHVVELVEPAAVPNPLYAHYVPGRAPTAEERHQQHEALAGRLRALVPADAAARSIRTEVHVVEAPDVSTAIKDLAESLDVSMLCMASHGRSGLARTLCGSVAREVLSATHRAVLVVRGQSRENTR